MDQRESVWGFVAIITAIAVSYIYYRWIWWLSWRKTRAIRPQYGQMWASPHGQHLYILGFETGSGDLTSTVVFTDIDPTTHTNYTIHRWSVHFWNHNVSELKLVLKTSSWLKESS